MADYFYVHKKILPNYLEKVLEAREMLDSREAATVTEATERIGISRNTYYRYKDYVFRAKDPTRGQQAVLSLLLADLPGALSAVLTCVTDHRASVLRDRPPGLGFALLGQQVLVLAVFDDSSLV
jgi:chorismate mutase